jgi:Fuc2NAc and GlcNAc transferase
MEHYWVYIAGAVLSFLITFLVRWIAIKVSIVDIPNYRSSHDVPTPRGGGISIAIVWFLGLLFLYTKGIIEANLFYALLSGLILVIISLLDDIISISYSVRLLFQIISISIGLYFLGGMELIDFGFFQIEHQIFLSVLAGIAILWFINLYNFIDGIDGYASAEAIFLSLAVFVLSGNSIILLFGASALGYIYWNFGKRKIFLGDIGSTLMGYTLGIIALYENNTGDMPILIFVILSGLFWFDATLTLFRRFRNREKLTQAHKKHAYQRFVQAGYSHGHTVIYSILINLILFAVAFIAHKYLSLVLALVLVACIFMYIVVRRVDKVSPFS